MIEKALSPLSFLLDLGTSKSSWSADLRDRQDRQVNTGPGQRSAPAFRMADVVGIRGRTNEQSFKRSS
ncbi:hypothetical protein MHYP_G00303740 [Metynnis hypsauchen]